MDPGGSADDLILAGTPLELRARRTRTWISLVAVLVLACGLAAITVKATLTMRPGFTSDLASLGFLILVTAYMASCVPFLLRAVRGPLYVLTRDALLDRSVGPPLRIAWPDVARVTIKMIYSKGIGLRPCVFVSPRDWSAAAEHLSWPSRLRRRLDLRYGDLNWIVRIDGADIPDVEDVAWAAARLAGVPLDREGI